MGGGEMGGGEEGGGVRWTDTLIVSLASKDRAPLLCT